MMVMCCNLIEVIRLRRELIKLVYECDQLGQTHEYLQRLAQKSERLVGAPTKSFDTSSVSGSYTNYVDYNDGSTLNNDLAFIEFDPSLKASLNFGSDCCIKALLTDLGVEELRAVVRY